MTMANRAILLLGNYPPPYGGVPSHVRDVSAYLGARGWNVHVLVGHTLHRGVERPAPGVTVHRPSKWQKLSALAQPQRPRISLRHFFPSYRVYAAWYALCAYCLQIIRDHDISLVSAYHLLGHGTLGAWLAAETGHPLITTIFGEIYSNIDKYRMRRREIDFVASYTRYWLSCSEHCAKSARLLGVDWPVQTLYYGVDIRHFQPSSPNTEIRRRLGWSDDDPVVVFVGRFDSQMGLDVLLNAIPHVLMRLTTARFLIAGSRGPLLTATQKCKESHPCNVAVVPDAAYDDLPDLYRTGSLAVAPSVDDRACLGLAIIEAMACARPVIGSHVGGTPEVIVDGETGFLVPSGDPVALANRLVEALERPAELARMGKWARERAQRQFDKDLANSAFESLALNLVQEERRAHQVFP